MCVHTGIITKSVTIDYILLLFVLLLRLIVL